VRTSLHFSFQKVLNYLHAVSCHLFFHMRECLNQKLCMVDVCVCVRVRVSMYVFVNMHVSVYVVVHLCSRIYVYMYVYVRADNLALLDS
jgi:hypothetical protein